MPHRNPASSQPTFLLCGQTPPDSVSCPVCIHTVNFRSNVQANETPWEVQKVSCLAFRSPLSPSLPRASHLIFIPLLGPIKHCSWTSCNSTVCPISCPSYHSLPSDLDQENHRTAQVRRDLKRSPRPTFCRKESLERKDFKKGRRML